MAVAEGDEAKPDDRRTNGGVGDVVEPPLLEAALQPHVNRDQDHLPGDLTGPQLDGQTDRGFDARVLPAVDTCCDQQSHPLVDSIDQRQGHANTRAGHLKEASHVRVQWLS